MNTNIDYRKYIEDSYNWARYKGLCKTKTEFARLVGVCPSTVSAANQKRYTGKNTARRIEAWRKTIEGPEYERIHDSEFNWVSFRREAAKVFASRLIGMGRDDGYKYSPAEVVGYAIVYADELVKQLRNEQ